MASLQAELDRVLADDYLDGLEALSLDDLRRRRADCQELEVSVSYLRRLVQGRLDIVHAEIERRASGHESDVHDMVEHLPEILSGQLLSPGVGRLPTLLAPDTASAGLTEQLDAVAGSDELGRLPERSGNEVHELAGSLDELERRVSAQRRSLHERMDLLQAELVARYKRGEASVDNVLPGGS